MYGLATRNRVAPAGALPFHAGGVTRNVPPSVPTVRELRLVAFA
jgi:hypothetical protein